MEVHQLLCFIAVAEELNFGKAARRLYMAQPPLSRHIKALEQDVGVALFVRSKRHVALTSSGQTFLLRAREILSKISIAADEVRRAENKLVGELNIAVSWWAGHKLVYCLLEEFKARAPEATLKLFELPMEVHLEKLIAGEIDASLFFPAWGGEGFVCETLFEEDLFVALPEGHRLAEQTCLRLSDLAEERWITFYRPGTKRLGEDFFKACARAGFQPNVVAQVHSLEARVTLVSEGMGVTIVPRSWEPRAHRPGVKTARIDRQDLSLPTAIFWRQGPGTVLRDAFLDTVRSIAGIFRDGMVVASSDNNGAAPISVQETSKPGIKAGARLN